MILSVSRRTDIPKYYMDWFMNRLEEGFVLVRNPMNHSQISKVKITKELVDGIVFWTKDAEPMIPHLDKLMEYTFYVQFTINPYDKDIETDLPSVEKRIDTFKRLSERIGKERTVWRYSPVLINEKYDYDYHIRMFTKLAETLSSYTDRCNLSFIEIYSKIKKVSEEMGFGDIPKEIKEKLANDFLSIAKDNEIDLGACGNLDLNDSGIKPSICVDKSRIESIGKIKMKDEKGSGSREGICYCTPSIDVGSYNTCLNGCVYCYANSTAKSLENKTKFYDVDSPMLCDSVKTGEKVTDRKVSSLATHQMDLFDRLHQNI